MSIAFIEIFAVKIIHTLLKSFPRSQAITWDRNAAFIQHSVLRKFCCKRDISGSSVSVATYPEKMVRSTVFRISNSRNCLSWIAARVAGREWNLPLPHKNFAAGVRDFGRMLPQRNTNSPSKCDRAASPPRQAPTPPPPPHQLSHAAGTATPAGGPVSQATESRLRFLAQRRSCPSLGISSTWLRQDAEIPFSPARGEMASPPRASVLPWCGPCASDPSDPRRSRRRSGRG